MELNRVLRAATRMGSNSHDTQYRATFKTGCQYNTALPSFVVQETTWGLILLYITTFLNTNIHPAHVTKAK
jgi:hypothetical protein